MTATPTVLLPVTPIPCFPAAPATTAPPPAASVETSSPDQTNEMVRSMVARLAERLKQDGSDVDGWMRLVRSYVVLGERDKALTAAADARQAFGTDADKRNMAIAWLACKHVKSNAVTIANNDMLVGAGAGQQERMTCCKIAKEKAGARAKGGAAASDAFFPFKDGPEFLMDAGVTAVIHPGGSIRDQETIDLVDSRGGVLVFTGQRHFRH